MSKNILLPVGAVVDVYKLVFLLDDYELDEGTRKIAVRVEDAIRKKVEAMEKRNAYAEYKTAATDAERETARQKYLDLAGIHPDWRWDAEAERQRRDEGL